MTVRDLGVGFIDYFVQVNIQAGILLCQRLRHMLLEDATRYCQFGYAFNIRYEI
jgi:hypothetical protein